MNFRFRNNKDNDIQKNHYKAWLISALAMLLLIGIESFTDFPYREKTCLELFEEIKLENPEASIDGFACDPGFITPKTPNFFFFTRITMITAIIDTRPNEPSQNFET